MDNRLTFINFKFVFIEQATFSITHMKLKITQPIFSDLEIFVDIYFIYSFLVLIKG